MEPQLMKIYFGFLKKRIIYVLLSSLLMIASGCGQTGDLFLPQQPNKKAPPLPTPSDIPDEGNSLDVTP
jgi:predicted small lipoprotein YifL